MTFSIIQKSQLEGAKRLDAEYYQPEYLENDKKILKFKNDHIGNFASVVYGTTPSGASFLEEGVPFVRSQNFNSSMVDEPNLVFCSEEFHKRNKKSEIKRGDILFAAVGATIGDLAIVQDSILKGNINQNIARVRINVENINPYFVWIFFNSQIGQLEIERLITGNAQPYLNSEQIKLFKVPIIDEQIIFKKYYLSIRSFLDEAETIYFQAENLLLEELKIKDLNLSEEIGFVVNLSEVKEIGRCDAEYFQPKYKKLVEHIKNNCNGVLLGDLVTMKKGIEPGAEEYQEPPSAEATEDTGVKQFIRVSSLSKFGVNDSDQKYLSEELYQKLKDDFEPKKGEILLTKDASPGIAYVLKEDIKGIVAGGILRLKLKNKEVEDEYLTLCINSVVGQMQAERDAGGSVIAHWKPEQIKNILTPILPKPVQQKIADLIRQSHESRKKAKELLEEAKRKVEELIEK